MGANKRKHGRNTQRQMVQLNKQKSLSVLKKQGWYKYVIPFFQTLMSHTTDDHKSVCNQAGTNQLIKASQGYVALTVGGMESGALEQLAKIFLTSSQKNCNGMIN